MLFRVITWLFVIGIIYRVLSRFVLPIFRITTATNDRLRQMQDQMRDMNHKVNENTAKPQVKKEGDYIDYEETPNP